MEKIKKALENKKITAERKNIPFIKNGGFLFLWEVVGIM